MIQRTITERGRASQRQPVLGPACMFLLVSTLTIRAQTEDDPAAVSIEALPEPLPEWAARAEPLVQPVTLAQAQERAARGDVFQLVPPTADDIAAADARAQARTGHIRPGPLRMGFVRPIEPQPLTVPGDWAVEEPSDDAEQRVWLLAIRSPGAFEMRVHLSGVDLGRSQLIVYALTDGGPVVRGPYHRQGPEGDGDFWPASLPGDTVFVEVTGPDEPSVQIAEIVHCDVDPHALGGDDPEGGPLSCHLDVMCFSVNTTARQAVGRMRYISDGNFSACTGTLIADLDSETFVPYFLTANHCVDETINLATLEVFWLFQETPCSPSNCPSDSCLSNTPDLFSMPSNVNATLLATSGATVGNDASFLRLHGGLPAGIGFAGWTNNEEIGVVGIHHPAGSWKRAFFGEYESTSLGCGADCGCFTPANYAFYSDVNGIVEPGSSGSAMFTSSGQVIGQLFGTCSLCPDAFNCFSTGDWCTQYGEWEQTYADASYWLQLGGTIWVNAANITPPWNGLQSDPYFSMTQAYNAAWDGTQLKIIAGNYPQNLTMSKQITLRAINGLVRIGQ